MFTGKGSDVRPGVPWSPLVCRWLLRGRRGTMCTGKGSDTPWRPLVSAGLSVAFAWQAWDNVHWQGVRCTPWRPLVSAGLSVAF